jgi:hypothetical protein
MKSPAELAARLRERLIHSRPHYDINGQPLRAIVVTQEWLEDMADAANALDAQCAPRQDIWTPAEFAAALAASVPLGASASELATQSRDSVGHNSTG